MTIERSQITSKRGDHGETTTLGGDDVSKSHPIIDCCGYVDELRAHVALLRQQIQAKYPNDAETADFLFWLLHCCFAIGSQCSDPRNAQPGYRQVDLGDEHINRLEDFQGKLEEEVKLPRKFIVSASNPLAAQTDVLTTYVRRLERAIVRLKEAEPSFTCDIILVFVNRLSDTLYMLARKFDDGNYQTVDYDVLR